MKSVYFDIDLDHMSELCAELSRVGFEPLDCFEGALLDSIFYDLGEKPAFRLGRFHLRRFLMITDYYINPNASGLRLTLTDSEKEFFRVLERYQAAQDEREKENDPAADPVPAALAAAS